MKRIEIAGTHQSASNYELDDGRIFRIHLKLITPKEHLATADFVEVETRGFEVDKKGSFVVDAEGIPVQLAPQRARIPLANVRQGMDSVKPGWIKLSLPTDEAARRQALEQHKPLKSLPKTGEVGDVKRVGDDLYTWTEGLYEQVRRGRLAEVANAAAAPKFDEAQVNDLTPWPTGCQGSPRQPSAGEIGMYISAGHSNTDPGAVANGRTEADIVVEFRNMVSFYLQRAKVRHELDGGGTTNLPLSTVVKSSRKHRLSVEFHCNAASSPKASGVEVLCAPKDNETAARICAAISETLGIPNRGVKPENAGQHSRLAFVQAGGMIVELFFITNKKDLAAYDAKKWLAAKEVARVLSEA